MVLKGEKDMTEIYESKKKQTVRSKRSSVCFFLTVFIINLK